MSDLMREQHAEALMLGLPCPFDCGRCAPPEPDVVATSLLTLDCGHTCEHDEYADDTEHAPLVASVRFCYWCDVRSHVVRVVAWIDAAELAASVWSVRLREGSVGG